LQVFRKADADFQNYAETGDTFKAEEVNPKELAESLGF